MVKSLKTNLAKELQLSGDGKTLIAGAWLNDGPGPLGADTGHARVFRLATLDASVSIATDTASIEILSDNVDRPEVVLSQATIQENRPVGTQVGTLSHNIADDLGQYTYSLIHDGTPDDNLSFNIVGDALVTNSAFDYEAKQTYTTRIRAVRDDGFQFTSSVTITITDVEESAFHFVPVGNPGNAADPATGSLYGDVNYEYSIGQYEITIGQYTEFLNAVAASDPYGLYNSSMASNAFVAGINRTGTEGSFSYTAMAASGDTAAGAQSAENRPITYVDWHDAARLANWMHNGRGPASTEDGAYRLNGATGGGAVARSPYAKYSVPTEDEWYKAAYYSPELNGGSGGYYAYATQSNTAPGISIGDTANQANYFTGRHATTPSSSATYQAGQNYLTDVGAFSGSSSYYGTFDQTGNVWEWNDLDGLPGSQRGFMGGMWNSTAVHQRSDSRWVEGVWNQRDNLGFRLVELDPTPPPSRGNTGVVETENAEGFAIEKIATIQNQLFTEDGLFVSVGDALSFSTVDSQELYVIRKDTATNSLTVDAAATPWKSQFDTTLTAIESFGSVELQRDSAGFLYANNQPITANGQHLSLDSFAGWSIVAADTVNGVNQLIWQNAGTGTLMPWVMDTSWSRVSTLASIDPSDTQSFADFELTHGVDLDNDGMLGGMTYVSPIGTDAVPPIYVAEGLNSIFFAAYSREFGIEPWVLPLGATTGDRFEVNNTLADATNLSVLEGLGGLRDLSIHVNDDIDVYRFEVTASGTSQDEIRIVSSGSATLSLYGSDPHNVDSYHVNTTLDPQTSLHTATIFPGLIAGNYHLDVRGNGSTAPFDYQLDWSLPTFVIEPDIFEPNDTQQTASEIWVEPGQNVLPPLTLHSHSDTDWYRFETIGDGTAPARHSDK
jgi:formylglycine-generating enzyme required for sulfatase activity